MLDIVCAQLGDMNKTVFVDTDIYKGSKIDNIPDDSFQLLTDAQILDIQDILPQNWRVKGITQIPARLEQISNNILRVSSPNPSSAAKLAI